MTKTALVTGASRGIGRAIAQRLARDGALVAVHYATEADAAADTVRSIEADGGQAFAVQATFGTSGYVDTLFDAVESGLKARLGSSTLDILVNNAGIKQLGEPEELTPQELDALFEVNAKAPFLIIQRALGLLPDGARIVTISSGITRFGNPQEIGYAMSKGAVEQLSLHWAKHLGPRGITINTVVPGVTDNGTEPVFRNPEIRAQLSEMAALKRVGETTDIADIVGFLASADARWITGALINASGGALLD